MHIFCPCFTWTYYFLIAEEFPPSEAYSDVYELSHFLYIFFPLMDLLRKTTEFLSCLRLYQSRLARIRAIFLAYTTFGARRMTSFFPRS